MPSAKASRGQPGRWLLISVPLLGFAILIAVLFGGLGNDPSLLPSVLINQPLPSFQSALVDQPEQPIGPEQLIAAQNNDIALLNVWATWCPTCRAEHEFLNSLKAQGVTIFGLNYKDERLQALEWLQQLGNPYRYNIDDSEGQIGIDLGVYGAPETFLLDGQGIIRYRHVGALDERIWQQDFVPRINQIKSET